MLKLGANILHSQGCCSAPLNGFSVMPKWVYYSLYRFCSIVQQVACLILESVAGFVKRIRQARCGQANETWTESNANNSKYFKSDLMPDRGLANH